MRNVDRTERMAVGVEVGAAHVDEQEVLAVIAHGVVDVPAIGLEAERALEVGEGGGAVGGCDLGDGARAWGLLMSVRLSLTSILSRAALPPAAGATVRLR